MQRCCLRLACWRCWWPLGAFHSAGPKLTTDANLPAIYSTSTNCRPIKSPSVLISFFFFVGSFSFLICILQFWYVFFLRLGYRRPHLVFMDLLRCVAMKSNHLHLLDYSFFVLLPCGGAGWRTQGFAWCDGSQTSTRRPSALLMQTDRSTTDCSRSPICTGAI